MDSTTTNSRNLCQKGHLSQRRTIHWIRQTPVDLYAQILCSPALAMYHQGSHLTVQYTTNAFTASIQPSTPTSRANPNRGTHHAASDAPATCPIMPSRNPGGSSCRPIYYALRWQRTLWHPTSPQQPSTSCKKGPIYLYLCNSKTSNHSKRRQDILLPLYMEHQPLHQA